MKFVFFRFRRTDKMDSVMKELMGQCPQNFRARTAPVNNNMYSLYDREGFNRSGQLPSSRGGSMTCRTSFSQFLTYVNQAALFQDHPNVACASFSWSAYLLCAQKMTGSYNLHTHIHTFLFAQKSSKSKQHLQAEYDKRAGQQGSELHLQLLLKKDETPEQTQIYNCNKSVYITF